MHFYSLFLSTLLLEFFVTSSIATFDEIKQKIACDFSESLCNWQTSNAFKLDEEKFQDVKNIVLLKENESYINLFLDFNKNELFNFPLCWTLKYMAFTGNPSAHLDVRITCLQNYQNTTYSVYSKGKLNNQIWTSVGLHIQCGQENETLVKIEIITKWLNYLKLASSNFEFNSCLDLPIATFENHIANKLEFQLLEHLKLITGNSHIDNFDLPIIDATSGTSKGHFIILKNEQIPSISNIPFIQFPSPIFGCLRLSVWKHSYNSAIVNVVQIDPFKKSQIIWSSTDIDPLGSWQTIEIKVNAFENTSLGFEFLNEKESNVALDDIQFSSVPCNPQASCNFEKDLDSFTILDNEHGNSWQIGNGKLLNPTNLNLESDSSYKIKLDQRMAYIDLTSIQTYYFLEEISFISGSLQPVSKATFVIKYKLIGNTDSSFIKLKVYQKIYNDMKILKEIQENAINSNDFQTVCIDIKSDKKFNIIILAQINLTNNIKKSKVPFLGISEFKYEQNSICVRENYLTQIQDNYHPIQLQCLFAQDLCDWSSEGTWYRTNNTDLNPFRPKMNSAKSSLVFHSVMATNSNSLITSPWITNFKLPYCLSLFYFMPQTKFKRSLDVILNEQETGKSTTLIQLTPISYEPFFSNWRHLFLPIQSLSPFSISLKSNFNSENPSIIAIHNLTIWIGSCSKYDFPPEKHCDFESDTCSFKSSKGLLSWEQLNHDYMNIFDHSSRFGKSLSVSSPFPLLNNEIVKLSMDLATSDFCVLAWIMPKIKPFADLIIQIRNSSNRKEFLVPFSQFEYWYPIQFEANSLSKTSQLELILNAESGITGNFYLDDLVFSPKKCDNPLICSFEQPCSWDLTGHTILPYFSRGKIQYINIENEFTIANQFGSFSKKDHTLNTLEGHYALFESIGKGQAAIRSPLLYHPNETQACIQFFFRRDQSQTTRISIFIQNTFSEKEGYAKRLPTLKLFNTNLFNDAWIMFKQEISLIHYDEHDLITVWIVAEATDEFEKQVIHIDDIHLNYGACPDKNTFFHCGDESGKIIHQYQVCDFIIDCPNKKDEQNCIDCDFSSKTLCGYKQLLQNTAIWKFDNKIRENISSQSVNLQDNALVMTPNFPISFNQSTTIISPEFFATFSTCKLEIDFYTLSLPLQVFLVPAYEEKIEIWRSLSNQTNKKIRQNILIGHLSKSHQIELGYYFHSSYIGEQSSILSISTSHCAFPKRKTKCDESEFHCTSGECIDQSFKCDHVANCKDGSDESDCSFNVFGCSFENSCDLFSSNSEKLSFSSAHNNLEDGPTRDHTLNSHKGHFWSLQSNPDQKLTKKLLALDLLAHKNCYIQFYYMAKNGKLIIGDDQHNRTINLIENYNWHKKQLFIGDLISEGKRDLFCISASVEAPSYENAFVAIDDITFSPFCYKDYVKNELQTSIDCSFKDMSDCQDWKVFIINMDNHTQLLNEYEKMQLFNRQREYILFKRKTFKMLDFNSFYLQSSHHLILKEKVIIQFRYLMNSVQASSVHFDFEYIDRTNLWTTTESTSDWKNVCIEYSSNYSFITTMAFSIHLTHPESWFSLADFKISRQANCPKTNICTFNTEACPHLSNIGMDNYTSLHSSYIEDMDKIRKEQQLTDYTYHSLNGHMIILSSKKKLASKVLKPIIPYCLNFWYKTLYLENDFLNENDTIPLGIFVTQFSTNSQLFQAKKSHPNEWIHAIINFELEQPGRILIKSSSEFKSDKKLAIDDLEIKEGSFCNPVTCDFTKDMCFWRGVYRENSIQNQWTLGTVKDLEELDIFNLPKLSENSLKRFAFTYMQKPNSKNEYSTFESSQFMLNSKSRCLQFSYFLGDEEQTDFMLFSISSKYTIPIWKSSNSTSKDTWTLVSINLISEEKTMSQYLSFVVLNKKNTDIKKQSFLKKIVALNEVYLFENSCESMNIHISDVNQSDYEQSNIEQIIYQTNSNLMNNEEFSDVDVNDLDYINEESDLKEENEFDKESINTEKTEFLDTDSKPEVEEDLYEEEEANNSILDTDETTTIFPKQTSTSLDKSAYLWKLITPIILLIVVTIGAIIFLKKPKMRNSRNITRERSVSQVWFIKNEEYAELY